MGIKLLTEIKEKKLFLLITGIYVLLMVLQLNYGLPNKYHPFPYQMDEWHQLMSIRAVYRHGTPNIPGAANGSVFQFIISGIYLVPFMAIHIINPFIIKNPLSSVDMQARIFEILRLNTLIFGVLSIAVIYKLSKNYLKINPLLTIIFFTFTPMWLMFSNFFKYDIALSFWIILSFFFFLRYSETGKRNDFIFASIVSGISFSTKLSAIPLFFILFIAFIFFTKNIKKNLSNLLTGVLSFIGVFVFAGIPDLLLGRGDYREYLSSNLLSVPKETANYIFGMPWWLYLIAKGFPLLFGHTFYLLFLLILLYFILKLIYGKIHNKKTLFILICFFLFAISLAPLQIGARGNRLLVLSPFVAILTTIGIQSIFKELNNRRKKYITVIIILLIIAQLLECFIWLNTKFSSDPQKNASVWMRQHIKYGTMIGIENIPIYQYLPNIIVKEFYTSQYGTANISVFHYRIIDANTKNLPNMVIITNTSYLDKLKQSPKKNLLHRLQKDNYKKIAYFSPDDRLYHYLGDSLDFYLSGLVVVAGDIEIYKYTDKVYQ